jgi:sigma-54 specific flagellar transcriptional regulator A
MTSYWTASCLADQYPVDVRLDALLVGDTPVMHSLKRAVMAIAASDCPVLVTGPTGAGKEVVAQALHLISGRDGPMIPVNCGAIPADLLESELFGHEKGAFTGAQARRIGLIEQAQGGTLFLDEIGDMPADVQVKLLRALETRQIQRVGGGAPIPVDFRLVSATNRDLHEDVRKRRFREDLLFRIEVFALAVPALRDRARDIPAILRAMSAARGDTRLLQLTPDAQEMLMRYDWPGNVRELRNFHDRAQVLFRNRTISARDVQRALVPTLGLSPAGTEPAEMPATDGGSDIRQMLRSNESVDMRGLLQRMEARLIETALDLAEGRVTRAAVMLRVKRTTLIGRMQKLGLGALPLDG